jgi:hypothetical protein
VVSFYFCTGLSSSCLFFACLVALLSAVRRVLRLVTGNTGGAKYMPLKCNLKGLNLRGFFPDLVRQRTKAVPIFFD